MEKKKLEIEIPEGKEPKLTTSDNGVYVEWVEKEKTWEQYVIEYEVEVSEAYGIILAMLNPCRWKKIFKFGLLQYIADDLNEEKIDWENGEQKKLELLYDHSFGKISYGWHVRLHCVAAIFTQKASEKAKTIIPAEFLKTF